MRIPRLPVVLVALLLPALAPLAQAPIASGDVITGTLSADDLLLDDGSSYDLYVYRGAAGEKVTFTLRSDAFDAYLSGGPLRGTEVTTDYSNDDDAGGTDATFTATLAGDGVFGVRANSVRAGATGRYVLTAESDQPSRSASGGLTIRAGQTVSGDIALSDSRLTDGSYYDLYTFSGASFETLEITLASGAFDAYLAGGATPEAAIAGADRDDDSAGGTDARLRVQADARGQYVIVANALRADATGPYTLSVRSVGGATESDDGLPVLTLGQTASGALDETDGTLNDGSHFDVYTYQGQPGEEVVISLTSADFDTFLMLNRVFGGELDKLAEDDDGGEGLNSEIRTTLGQSGTYVIVANSAFAGARGAYMLSVSRSDGTAVADGSSGMAVLQPGQPLAGTLDASDSELADGSFADTYVFRGTPGETVSITLRSGAFDAYLSVASIEGDDVKVVARDDDGGGGSDSQIRLTVSGSGVYAVQANSYGPAATGAYTLSVEGASAPEARDNTATSRFAGKWSPAGYQPTSDYSAIRDIALRQRRLEGTAAGLNAEFPLPRNVSLSFSECGQPNAFYNPNDASVNFCYELVGFLADALRGQVEADRLEEAIGGAYDFIILHEAGHALTDQLDLPITGREEDVADQFAALMLIKQGTKGARAAIDGVLALQQGQEFSSSDYADEHSLGPVRLYNVVCLVYGSDPQKYSSLVGTEGLPEARAVRCPSEYEQVEKSFSRLLGFVYAE